MPLALKLWSSRSPGFRGENDEVLKIIRAVYAAAWIGRNIRREVLAEHLARLGKRLGEVPEFAAYAIADGIKRGVSLQGFLDFQLECLTIPHFVLQVCPFSSLASRRKCQPSIKRDIYIKIYPIYKILSIALTL